MPRKKPFSSKQKKFQLQQKRRRKTEHLEDGAEETDSDLDQGSEVKGQSSGQTSAQQVDKMNQQPREAIPDRRHDPNRYRLHFFKESEAEIQRRKESARKAFHLLPEEELEVDTDVVYKPGTVLDLPKRPPWDYSLSKAKLEARENKYFQQYHEKIFAEYPADKLSYFELNLETWRQLWRVLEMSDVLLLIIDIRYPGLHFSPALYHHVTHDLGKPIIVVFNKIDLVEPCVVIAWKKFMEERYPKANIVLFTSYPKDALSEEGAEAKAKRRRKRRNGRRLIAMGTEQLYDVCQSIVKDKVDLSNWRYKITQDASRCEEDASDEESEDEEEAEGGRLVEEVDSDPGREMFKDGILTVGCVGYPNVGKSSLLNGLVGRKVVSVSKTPGHTKHFQTIFLTPTVKLCDCPGLVFPSLIEKPLQILAGIYPIAQVREPYTPVGFLSSRVDVVKQLKLKEGTEKTGLTEWEWSAMDVCEAWAQKRGFYTARAGRLDVYRAANNLLRMALDGRICLSLKPPGFTAKKEFWLMHQETEILCEELQKFVEPDSDSDNDDVPESDDEFEGEKETFSSNEDEDDDKDRENEKEKGFSSKNPFELLMEDD